MIGEVMEKSLCGCVWVFFLTRAVDYDDNCSIMLIVC